MLRLWTVLFCLAICAVQTAPARAADLHIAIVSRTVFYVPVWIAQNQAYFRDEGITADITVYNNAEDINAALTSGKVQIAISTPESVIVDVYRGGSLRIVAGNAQRLPHFIIANPRIRTLAQLRGATFGVLSINEGTTYLVRRLAETIGLKPDEYKILPVGGAPARWELLRNGKIDAGLQPFPLSYEAEAAGFTNLGPITDYVRDYLFTSVNVDERWAKENSQTVARFLRALRRGQDFIASNPARTAAIAAKELETSVALSERALADTKRLGILSEDLSVSEAALRGTFDTLDAVGLLPKGAAFESARVVDADYLTSSRQLP